MLSPFRFEGVYHGLLSICGQKQQLFIWGGISPTKIKKYRHKIKNLLIN